MHYIVYTCLFVLPPFALLLSPFVVFLFDYAHLYTFTCYLLSEFLYFLSSFPSLSLSPLLSFNTFLTFSVILTDSLPF